MNSKRPFYVNLRGDTYMKEGMYSIRTADLGDQHYAVKRQPKDAKFAPGELLVYKVEILETWHQEYMYRQQRWEVLHNSTHEQYLAFKAFAFANDGGINVWKRFRNGYQKRKYFNSASSDQMSDNKGVALPSKMLWETHAEILWRFALGHHQQKAGKNGVQFVDELEGCVRLLPAYIED